MGAFPPTANTAYEPASVSYTYSYTTTSAAVSVPMWTIRVSYVTGSDVTGADYIRDDKYRSAENKRLQEELRAIAARYARWAQELREMAIAIRRAGYLARESLRLCTFHGPLLTRQPQPPAGFGATRRVTCHARLLRAPRGRRPLRSRPGRRKRTSS